MNTLNRRTFASILGIGAIVPTSTFAQDHGSHHADATPDASVCGHGVATPQIVPYDSNIPFDLAYIDTMIPHHVSVVALAEVAVTGLEDSRLVAISQAVIDTQPGEIEQLQTYRDEWFAGEPTTSSEEHMMEMMMVTMAGSSDGCMPMGDHGSMEHDGNMSSMQMMDGDSLVQMFNEADNKDLAFIDLVIPHHQMAVRQSEVGLVLAEHEELRALCQAVIDAQGAEIAELRLIREELVG